MSLAIGVPDNDFTTYFKLSNPQEIREYFPATKGFCANLQTNIRTLSHFMYTGSWISTDKLCDWAMTNPNYKISQQLMDRRVFRKVLRSENRMVIPRSSFLAVIKKILSFIWEYIKHPMTVGAILPSSKALAKEMVREIPKDIAALPRLILEVGPGTGEFSNRIIKRMNPQDTLHLVEFDANFAEQLKERYQDIPNVKVIHGDILQHDEKGYDHIVSGLPLNGLPAAMTDKVFAKFLSYSKKETKISYFEYAFVKKMMVFFANKEEKSRLNHIQASKDAFYAQYGTNKTQVFFNVPPAQVCHHTIAAC